MPRLRLLPLLLALSCAGPKPEMPAGWMELRRDVFVEALAPGVWRHVSFRSLPKVGPFPSNGAILRVPDGALIVDTAWNPEQTAAILDWAEAHVGPVRGLLVTHAHDDRLGGLAETDRRAIPSYALAETSRLAEATGQGRIGNPVGSGFSLSRLGAEGELFFPGAGHTRDNAVVWLAGPRILVGGCMVRAAGTTSLGNTEEADLGSWSEAMLALQDRYPDVQRVLPGHGEPGTAALLTHTIELVVEARGRAPQP